MISNGQCYRKCLFHPGNQSCQTSHKFFLSSQRSHTMSPFTVTESSSTPIRDPYGEKIPEIPKFHSEITLPYCFTPSLTEFTRPRA